MTKYRIQISRVVEIKPSQERAWEAHDITIPLFDSEMTSDVATQALNYLYKASEVERSEDKKIKDMENVECEKCVDLKLAIDRRDKEIEKLEETIARAQDLADDIGRDAQRIKALYC